MIMHYAYSRRQQWILLLFLLSLLLPIADAKSSSASPPATLIRWRGGFSGASGGGGGGGGGESSAGDIDDEELDEYIDFLLAAAEDKVTEDENPLFKRFRELAREIDYDDAPSDEEDEAEFDPAEEGAQEVVITTSSAEESSATPEASAEYTIEDASVAIQATAHESSDPVISEKASQPAYDEESLKPMVQNANDEAQLDDMIETLVASVKDDDDDEDLEEFSSDEVKISSTTSSQSFEVDEGIEEDVSSVDEIIESIVEAVVEEKTEVLSAEASVALDPSSENEVEPESILVSEANLGDDHAPSIEAAVEEDNTCAPNAPLEDESSETEAEAVKVSLHEEVGVDQEIEPASHTGQVEAPGDELSPTALEHKAETSQEAPLVEVPLLSPSSTTMELQAVPEVSIAENSLVLDGPEGANQIMIEKSVEESPEFFLGPSAVEGSPHMLEETITEAVETTTQKLEIIEELDEKNKEPEVQEHLYDVKSTRNAAESLVETPAEEVPVAPSELGNSVNTWGKFTARLLGIKSKAEKMPSTSMGYTQTWGKWAALLMGIKDGSDTQQSTRRKKDFDRIYKKYYADYVPDPVLYGYIEEEDVDVAQEDRPIESGVPDDKSGSIFSKRKKQAATFWGTLGKLMNQERGKPIAFLSGEMQTNQEPVDDSVMSNPGEEDDTAMGGLNAVSTRVLNDGASSSNDVGTTRGEDVPVCFDEEEGEEAVEPIKNDSEVQGDSEEADAGSLAPPDVRDRSEGEGEGEGEDESDTAQGERFSPEPIEVDTTQAVLIDEEAVSSSEKGETTVEIVVDDAANELVDEEEEIKAIPIPDLNNEYEEYDEEDLSLQPPQEDIPDVVDEIFDGDGCEAHTLQDDFEEDIEGDEIEYVDPITNMQSTRALKHETINFFYKFLILRGMEAWLMTIVLLVEWCRVYLSPFPDFFSWLFSKQFKSTSTLEMVENNLLERLRGGSEAGDDSLSCEDDGSDEPSKRGSDEETVEKVEDSNNRKNSGLTPIPRSRPNPLYRHLFGYGRLGHILIMECILLHEWLDTYLPALSSAFSWTAHQMFPSLRNPNGVSDEPLSQTTGFVGADGSAVRGAKKKSSQTRKDDQKALTQLKQVGDVTQAKYRFLSKNFMKRHEIGEFADDIATNARLELDKPRPPSAALSKKQAEEDFEPESDAEWIVSALTQDGKADSSLVSSDPYVEPGVRKSAPTITVGFEIGSSSRSRRRKRPAISDVTRLTSVAEKKKLSAPRVSDRESGVMGRIRAAGANSLVGRNLLGAYPGDAPPPDEAANPHGLYDLAEKYGYGEWSDTEDDFLSEPRRRKRRSRQTEQEEMDDYVESPKRKKKRRRNTSHVELDFGLGITSSSTAPSPVVKATNRNGASRPPDEPMTKLKSKERSKTDQDIRKSVAQVGLDAVNKKRNERSRDSGTSKSELTAAAKDPMSRIREAKSESGMKSVANSGLRHITNKQKTKDSEESK